MGGDFRGGDRAGAEARGRTAAGPAADHLSVRGSGQRDPVDDHLRQRLPAIPRPDGVVRRPVPGPRRRPHRSTRLADPRRGPDRARARPSSSRPASTRWSTRARPTPSGCATPACMSSTAVTTASPTRSPPSPARSRRPTSPAARSPVWCARAAKDGFPDARTRRRTPGPRLRRLRDQGDGDAHPRAGRSPDQGARRRGQLSRPVA